MSKVLVEESELAKLREDSERLAWLHKFNKDSEGYEYGVCRVKYDQYGKLVSCLWTASDHSDIDAVRKGQNAST